MEVNIPTNPVQVNIPVVKRVFLKGKAAVRRAAIAKMRGIYPKTKTKAR